MEDACRNDTHVDLFVNISGESLFNMQYSMNKTHDIAFPYTEELYQNVNGIGLEFRNIITIRNGRAMLDYSSSKDGRSSVTLLYSNGSFVDFIVRIDRAQRYDSGEYVLKSP